MSHPKIAALLLLLIIPFINGLCFPQTLANQNIYTLNAPEIVYTSQDFSVTINVPYYFPGEDEVKVWARILDPATDKYVEYPIEDPNMVRGAGDSTWNFHLTAPTVANDWTLEIYALHWDNDTEIIDFTRQFIITVKTPPLSNQDIKIDRIIKDTDTFTLNEKSHITISTIYHNLEGTPLLVTISDDKGRVTQVLSEHSISGTGNYTFPWIVLTPSKIGNWELFFTVEAQDRVTDSASITIPVIARSSQDIDFSLTIHPKMIRTKPKTTVVYDVFIHNEDTSTEPITLTLSGHPDDSIYTFSPLIGKLDLESQLAITIPERTEGGAPFSTGTYTLMIKAQSGNTIHIANTTLIVESIEKTTTHSITDLTDENHVNPLSILNTMNIGYLGLILLIAIFSGLSYFLLLKRGYHNNSK